MRGPCVRDPRRQRATARFPRTPGNSRQLSHVTLALLRGLLGLVHSLREGSRLALQTFFCSPLRSAMRLRQINGYELKRFIRDSDTYSQLAAGLPRARGAAFLGR